MKSRLVVLSAAVLVLVLGLTTPSWCLFGAGAVLTLAALAWCLGGK